MLGPSSLATYPVLSPRLRIGHNATTAQRTTQHPIFDGKTFRAAPSHGTIPAVNLHSYGKDTIR